MKMPPFHDGAGGRQHVHAQAHSRQHKLGHPLVVRSELKQIEEVARQPPHQEEVQNEDNDVEQQTTIVFGEDVWGRRHFCLCFCG